MTLIDLDSKDVQNYTNKDGLIAVSDLRLLTMAYEYVDVVEVFDVIDNAQKYAKTIPHNRGETETLYRGVDATCETIKYRIERLICK